MRDKVTRSRQLFAAATLCLSWVQGGDPAYGLQWDDLRRETARLGVGMAARLRYEWWKGLEAARAAEQSYDMVHLRVRPSLEYRGTTYSLFLQLQYAGTFDLPLVATSGPGQSYFTLSRPDDHPDAVDLIECFLRARDFLLDGLSFTLGRQGIKDGEEVLYGDAAFDRLKKSRLSERLVGTWDWTNVGRRYDALRVSYERRSFQLDAFAAKVLSGGFEYSGAYSQLDDVDLIGGVFTMKKDALIPGSEVRFFHFYYRDDRQSAREVTGGALGLHTFGTSLVGLYPAGETGALDTVLWASYQWGDWGRQDQSAYAVIAEAGYQFRSIAAKPWLRVGMAHASGDQWPAGGHHTTFFDLTPTNHKFYGFMDTTALSNLLNPYVQLVCTPHPALELLAEGNFFMLHRSTDSWYAGSGPSRDDTFGYAGGYDTSTGQTKRLANGSAFVGSEIDVSLTYRPSKDLAFTGSYAHFFGADGAKAVYPEERNAHWVYAQLEATF